jgi:CheY-like chemotaxis protein
MTAHAMVGDRERALNAGCSECLTKPYEISELLALVGRYLGEDTAKIA